MVEDAMYVSQGVIPISAEGMPVTSKSVPGVCYLITFWSDSRRLRLPAVKLLCKAIEPQMTAVVHLGTYNKQRSPGEFKKPDRPCFAVVVYNETWWPMYNVHLSYNPPISWRIMFWSVGIPQAVQLFEKFRALVVPGGGCRKGIIIQWRQLKIRFSCGRPVMHDKKRGCNGSVCPCTYTEE